MNKNEPKIKYEIINEIGIISENKGWRLELNRVSWNGEEPKYDLRRWSDGHTRMGKGVTLTAEELLKLSEVLAQEARFIAEDQK